jgi:selenide,water dikinase
LNAVGRELGEAPGVHAVTDVTGFGLLGHLLEVCRGSGLAAEITTSPPLLAGAEALARVGVRTGASARNWQSYGEDVRLPADFPDWKRDMLTDPQTSGGLLIAVAQDEADKVLALVRSRGFAAAAIVGRMSAGAPQIRVG